MSFKVINIKVRSLFKSTKIRIELIPLKNGVQGPVPVKTTEVKMRHMNPNETVGYLPGHRTSS